MAKLHVRHKGVSPHACKHRLEAGGNNKIHIYDTIPAYSITCLTKTSCYNVSIRDKSAASLHQLGRWVPLSDIGVGIEVIGSAIRGIMSLPLTVVMTGRRNSSLQKLTTAHQKVTFLAGCDTQCTVKRWPTWWECLMLTHISGLEQVIYMQ